MAQTAGFAPQTATLLTGLISFVGAFGRLGFGRIFDKSGHLTAVRTDGCLIAGSAAFMLIAFSYHSPILFAVGLLLLGFCFGGMSSICAALAGRLYGLRFYAQNLSIISLQMIPASLLGPMISGAIYDRTGSYTLVFVVVLILSLLTNLIGYHIDR
jgi:OFA family oxalate/formate antiporter-like MFS transporter